MIRYNSENNKIIIIINKILEVNVDSYFLSDQYVDKIHVMMLLVLPNDVNKLLQCIMILRTIILVPYNHVVIHRLLVEMVCKIKTITKIKRRYKINK